MLTASIDQQLAVSQTDVLVSDRNTFEVEYAPGLLHCLILA